MDKKDFKLIQDSDEYNAASDAIESAGHNLFQEYVTDEPELFRILDAIQSNVTKLRELFKEPKEDKPDDLEASPFLHEKGSIKNLRAVRSNGTFVQKDDILHSFRAEGWTFQSVTQTRKLWVTAKDDPNGPDSWPNMASREYYPEVFNLGIWDIQFKEWTFKPNWEISVIKTVEFNLTNLDYIH